MIESCFLNDKVVLIFLENSARKFLRFSTVSAAKDENENVRAATVDRMIRFIS